MAEYIKRDEAIAALDEFRLNETVSKYATVMQCKAARDAISRSTKVLESLPAADVEPVRHGHNIYPKSNRFECSLCGYEDWDTMTCTPEHHNFCPNCGARMDEEGST